MKTKTSTYVTRPKRERERERERSEHYQQKFGNRGSLSRKIETKCCIRLSTCWCHAPDAKKNKVYSDRKTKEKPLKHHENAGGTGRETDAGRAHGHTQNRKNTHSGKHAIVGSLPLTVIHVNLLYVLEYNTLRMSACFLLLLYTSIFSTYSNTIHYVYLYF